MKLHSFVLITALTLTVAACDKKKSSDEEKAAQGPAKPVAFHKITECPDMRGEWQQDISIPAGVATVLKMEFGGPQIEELTVNRVSQENEIWKIDGMLSKDKDGSEITAYCEASAIIVEILKTDNSYEFMSFTADAATGNMILRTDKTLGRIDHTTQDFFVELESTENSQALLAAAESALVIECGT